MSNNFKKKVNKIKPSTKLPHYMMPTTSISQKYGSSDIFPKMYNPNSFTIKNKKFLKMIDNNLIKVNKKLLDAFNEFNDNDNDNDNDNEFDEDNEFDDNEFDDEETLIEDISKNKNLNLDIVESSKKMIDQLANDENIDKAYIDLSILEIYLKDKVKILRDSIKGEYQRPPDEIIL